MKYDYNPALSPPAPFVTVRIADPVFPSRHHTLSAEVDTGADITAIPQSVVAELALAPAGTARVAGYEGRAALLSYYDVILSLAGVNLVGLSVVAVEGEFALVGRDVLNHFRTVLDGPALTLEIIAVGGKPATR